MAPAVHEALRSDLLTCGSLVGSMVVLKDSLHRFVGAIAGTVAYVGHLVVPSAVAADDSGMVDYIETRPYRSLMSQPAE